MPELNRIEIERYLKSVAGESAKVVTLKLLGEDLGASDIKGYGYGTPVLIEYEIVGRRKRAVLHTVRPGPFGHEHMADRAQMLLWDHSSFNRLPRHARSLDVGAFLRNGVALSLDDADEFFELTEYVEGRCYNKDLESLRDSAPLTEIAVARADALCDYLVEIHRVRGTDAGLYVRRVRELVGHAECIMGLIDSYPSEPGVIDRNLLREVERRAVDWRWRLKDRGHRLRQVHGDFHPWNILFREGTDFSVIDRSRGEWGDPADDVTSLTMNYLFFSLQRSGRLDGNLESMFKRFWDRYLAKTGDREMLEVVAPFFIFRGLVMAHPVWYPGLAENVRRSLFNFMLAVADESPFNPDKVNQYCEA